MMQFDDILGWDAGPLRIRVHDRFIVQVLAEKYRFLEPWEKRASTMQKRPRCLGLVNSERWDEKSTRGRWVRKYVWVDRREIWRNRRHRTSLIKIALFSSTLTRNAQSNRIYIPTTHQSDNPLCFGIPSTPSVNFGNPTGKERWRCKTSPHKAH